MNMKYIALLQLLIVSNLSVSQTGKSGFQTKEIFRTPEAKQGVAVDADYFYTVSSTGIGKYSKKTGTLISSWKDSPLYIIPADVILCIFFIFLLQQASFYFFSMPRQKNFTVSI